MTLYEGNPPQCVNEINVRKIPRAFLNITVTSHEGLRVLFLQSLGYLFKSLSRPTKKKLPKICALLLTNRINCAENAAIWRNMIRVTQHTYAVISLNKTCTRKFGRSAQFLTQWGRDKMVVVSQTTLSNAFSWMKMPFKISLKFVSKGITTHIFLPTPWCLET